MKQTLRSLRTARTCTHYGNESLRGVVRCRVHAPSITALAGRTARKPSGEQTLKYVLTKFMSEVNSLLLISGHFLYTCRLRLRLPIVMQMCKNMLLFEEDDNDMEMA
ncbi:hypothetical protein BaRGS_00013485 [Batillaria attramentaria]|uniref:Uncharacterized protein n=1 Tax=Batillaria attramentaria TaxID=370345 RepID=A0ABD0L7Q2_9CAEN